MSAGTWELMAAGLAVVAPLVGVPLTVMTFYLKGLREQQAGRFSDLSDRVNTAGDGLRRLVDDVASMQRDYATKEEWLRETLWARGRIEALSVALTRVETEVDGLSGLGLVSERTHRLVAELARRAGVESSPAEGRADGESS